MSDYQQAVQKIRAMKKELNTYYVEMSPYERRRIEAAIENEIERSRPVIVAGMKTDWDIALAQHKAAGRAVDEARRKEAGRWQTDKLGLEIQLTRMQFDRCQSVAEARALYDQGMASHDAAKMRATAEICAGALNKFPGDRLPAHRLAVEASRKAAELTTTPEIITTLERGAEAVQRVVELQQEIGTIAQEIGASSDLYRELNRAQVHTRYNEDRGGWETSIEIREAEAVTA